MFINDRQLIAVTIERKPELFSEKEKRFITMMLGTNESRMYTTREISKELGIPGSKLVKFYKEILKKAQADTLEFYDDPRRSFLESIDLSTRAINVLHKHNVFDLKDLATVTKADLEKMRNIGAKTIAEIEEKAAEFGIELKEA